MAMMVSFSGNHTVSFTIIHKIMHKTTPLHYSSGCMIDSSSSDLEVLSELKKKASLDPELALH